MINERDGVVVGQHVVWVHLAMHNNRTFKQNTVYSHQGYKQLKSRFNLANKRLDPLQFGVCVVTMEFRYQLFSVPSDLETRDLPFKTSKSPIWSPKLSLTFPSNCFLLAPSDLNLWK